MPYKDKERGRQAANERKRRWRERQHIARYGVGAGNMSGKHGNHAKGASNGRWAGGRWIHQDGYIAVKVPAGHHLRMANGYAYKHQIEAEKMLGRRLTDGETVHHINGNVQDNRHENILVLDRSSHALIHATAAKRNRLGQFVPGLKRIQQWPEGF